MDRIGILSPNGLVISKYLNSEMNNIDVIVFNNIYEFENRLKRSALRIDTLIIQDSGLSPSNDIGKVRESTTILKHLIVNSELFEVDRIIYLNVEGNNEHLNMMNWLKDSREIKNKTNIIVYTYEHYTVSMVKELLMKTDVTFNNAIEYNYVIRKKKNTGLKSKYLDRFQTDKTVVVELSTANTEINDIKEQLVEYMGDKKVKGSLSEKQETPIQEIDITTPLSLSKEVVIEKNKIIGVVGESKSGTSTTAAILASTASLYGKTLLLDLNYSNLGLSYLIEKTFIHEEINEIDLGRDLIQDTDGIKVLREKTFDSRQLHVITNSLPVVSKISLEEYAVMITNIVYAVQSSYKYIVMDIPVDLVSYYADLINKLDKLIMCSPPYMNNIVSLLTKISESPIIHSNLFSQFERDGRLKHIHILRTLVFARVHHNIKAVNKDVVDRYSKKLLNRLIGVTGVYVFSAKSYTDTTLFQQLVEI